MVSKPLNIGFLISVFMLLPLSAYEPESDMMRDIPSVKKYIAESLLVPGLGEFNLGNKIHGQFFFLTEVGLWLFLSERHIAATMAELRFKSYAAKYARIDPVGKSDQYFIDIGNYESIESFNEEQLRQRNPDNIWPENSGYDWEWDQDEYRKRFRKIRIKRDMAKKTSRFIIGGIILNHILSAIDAGYLYRISNFSTNKSLVPTVEFSRGEVTLGLRYLF